MSIHVNLLTYTYYICVESIFILFLNTKKYTLIKRITIKNLKFIIYQHLELVHEYYLYRMFLNTFINKKCSTCT